MSPRIVCSAVQWSLRSLLALLLCFCIVPPELVFAGNAMRGQDQPLVTMELRYHMPEAGEVFLIWGINGWVVVDEVVWPPGTVVKDEVMHTPMARQGDVFIVQVQVPAGVVIDYGFLITETRSGGVVHVWEADGEQDYHTIVTQDGVLEVQTKLTLVQDGEPVTVAEGRLVTQEIRYHMPEAGEVFLIWGINGWSVVAGDLRPAGTVVKNDVMHTPMTLEGDAFVAEVQVPIDAAIEFGFLITKKHNGAEVAAVWDGADDYRIIATQDGAKEVQATLSLIQARELPTALDIGLYLLLGIGVILGIGVGLARVPQQHNHRAVTLALLSLTILGLALRLSVVGTTQRLHDVPVELIGDEPRYDELAYALLQGEFFQQPTATPVYPLFLAACYLVFGHSYGAVLYVQALVGVMAIPLTYRLAQRFTGRRGALFAGALIALNPVLISHVGYLYTESLYAFLLLLTVQVLLWALEAPLLRRYALAGVLLGISALCRPAIVLFSACLPALLPRVWSLRRRVVLCVVYGGAVAAVIVPWTYHNYRTHNTFMPFSLSMTMLWHGSPEFYHLMQQKQNAIIEVWDEELDPDRNGGINPVTIEGDRYFNARAIASIRAEPGVYAWYSLQKLAFFWIGHPASNYDWPFNFDVLRVYFSAREIAGIFGMRLLLLLAALVSLVVLRRRLRAFAPLLLLCAYHMLVYAILAPIARYSEPLYPVLATIVAAAAGEMGCRHQIRRERSEQVALAASMIKDAGVRNKTMRLRTKKTLDFYGGGALMALLKPWVWGLGQLLGRDHTPQVRGSICFIKMLGGGSLVIAYPALLGLRRRYPAASFSLITTKEIKPFAESLGVFHRVDEIDDSSFFQIVRSGLRCLWRNFWVDTVVDLEVYSRLTTVLSTLTGARNRIGFYLEAVFWRRRLHTHLIFFNQFSGVFRWYDAVVRLLGAEPAPLDACQCLMRERLGPSREQASPLRRIAVGHSCSGLGVERMLDQWQWLSVFQQHFAPEDRAEVLLLGSAADRTQASKIITTLAQRFPNLRLQNLCGELPLTESLRALGTCQEFWGIDSALLHYARLLGLKCVSYWGPTDPATRLRPLPRLNETVHYRKVPCSPCIHVTEEPPCRGQNLCIQSLFHRTRDYDSISWLAYGDSGTIVESDGHRRKDQVRPMAYPDHEVGSSKEPVREGC